MIQNADILIIGGGITGLLTAIHLQESQAGKVFLLERHYVGSGQSHRAAGVVRALVRDVTVAAALTESIQFFKTFQDRFDDPIALHPAGYLLLSEPEQMAVLQETISVAGQAGCVAMQIDCHQAQQLQPGLRTDNETLYVYEPDAIHLDPMPTVQALRRVAERLGVKIMEGCEAGKILLAGDQVVGVESSLGQFNAPQVLVATSVWGKQQLAQLGVEIPVYPHRAEMAFFEIPPSETFHLSRIISDTRSMLYLRPEGDRQIFVGWREGDRIHSPNDLVAEDPDNYKQTADFTTVMNLHHRLSITLPPMADGFVHRTYACVYDVTLDQMPILDRVASIDGLYVALGFSGGGFSLSPWVGRAMSELILKQKTPTQIERFDWQRFAEGRTFHWSNIKTTPPDQANTSD